MDASIRYKGLRQNQQKTGPINPELDGLVIDLWNSGGKSYTQIAVEVFRRLRVQLTRSQIGGKINRAEARGVTVRRPGSPQNILEPGVGKFEKKSRSYAERKAATVKAIKPPPKEKEAPKSKTMAAAKPAPAPALLVVEASLITLEEVQAKNGCRFPRGDKPDVLWCGQPRKPESSYCPQHHARCHSATFHMPPDKRLPRSML